VFVVFLQPLEQNQKLIEGFVKLLKESDLIDVILL
jgi:hypothetical protein